MAYIAICKREFGELLRFLRAPQRKPHTPPSGWRWLVRMLGLWLPTLVLSLLVSAALHGLKDRLGLSHFLDTTTLTTTIVIASCLVAPLTEEAIFRWGLRSASYTLIAGPMVITAFMIRDTVSAGVFLATGLSVLAITLIFQQRKAIGQLSKIQLSRNFLENYPKVFWLYTIAFALVHIRNYSSSSIAGLIAVALLQIPQFLMGVVAGYLRLRDGLRSSIALHILHNTSAISLVLLLDAKPGQ